MRLHMQEIKPGITGIASLLLSIFLCSCANKNTKTAEKIIQTSLDAVGTKANRDKIQNLVSLADCVSPNGKYITEIHTALGNYSYFKQVYSYRPAAFEAVIRKQNKWLCERGFNKTHGQRSYICCQGA